METDTDQLDSLLSLILLGTLFVVIILLFLPKIGNFGSNEPETADDALNDLALQPMRKIFLNYKHSSVSDWINWIKSQDISLKNIAFNNLTSYLESDGEEIGSLVSEAIKAVVAFKYPESFTSIHTLLENVRKHWGSYHTADQFYGQAAYGLVELNKERAQSILIDELELIKNKHDPQKFIMAIMDALSELPTNEELNTFWFKALKDPQYDMPVREHIIELLKEQVIDSRVSIISQFFNFWNKSDVKKISDNDLKTIEGVFYANQDLIVNENYDLWNPVLKSCNKKLIGSLFVSLIAATLEKVTLSEELLVRLFETPTSIRSEFSEALAKKHTLYDEELELIKAQYIINIKKSSDIVDIKKYKKNKKVPILLDDAYQHLVRALSLDQEFKNNNLPILDLILGPSLHDKQYLIECLAANHNRRLLNVNLPELLSSASELARLKPLINQNKPCIVYLHGLGELINGGLNDLEMINLEPLNNLFKEFKPTVGVNFLTSLEVGQELLSNSQDLQDLLNHIFQLKYGLIRDVDKPDILTRQKLLSDCIKKVVPSRLKSSAGLELIAKQTEDYSLIEYLTYIHDYIRFCLLVYGELKSPAELKMPGVGTNDDVKPDPDEASV